MHVSHEGRKIPQARLRIDPRAVPSQQSADGERMTQTVQAGRGRSGGNFQPQPGPECVESLGDRGWINRFGPARIKGEERLCRVGHASLTLLLQVLAQACTELWTERHQPTFEELRFAYDQKVALLVNIVNAKAGDFSHSQTQAIHQGKDQGVDPTAVTTVVIVRQLGCRPQQLLSLRAIEEERHLNGSRVPWPALNRGLRHAPLAD